MLTNRITELSKRPVSSDSVQEFEYLENQMENKTLRENYEKTMERMVLLEEHLKTIGAEAPPDEFWDRK